LTTVTFKYTLVWKCWVWYGALQAYRNVQTDGHTIFRSILHSNG